VNSKSSEFAFRIICITGVLTTVIVNPWLSFDPINLPKMLILSTGSGLLIGWLLVNRPKLDKQFRLVTITLGLLATTFIFSFFSNSAPWYQQLWGTWGRSTGLVTYISFLIVMLASMFFVNTNSLSRLRLTFERLGYFITSYTLLQLLDLDPINWSQKIMIATLGNINFMSSFLGLTSISYVSQLLKPRANLITKSFYVLLVAVNLTLIMVSESIQGIGVFLSGLALLISYEIRFRLNAIKAFVFFLIATTLGLIAVLGSAGIGPLSALRQDTVLFRIDYWQTALNMLVANPWNGVGFDSYGDFYREFRNLEAVTRTGPQRITNTAHNIFLDVSVNAGIVAGLLFTAIMFLTGISVFRSFKHNSPNLDFQALSSMWLGFVVFCLISINQIGVGVWGFIFMGAINGLALKQQIGREDSVRTYNLSKRKLKGSEKVERAENQLTSESSSFKKVQTFGVSTIFAIAMFAVAFLPNLADAQYLGATKSRDLNAALKVIGNVGIQDYHTENLIMGLEKQGRAKEALTLALALSKTNPQSWQAWVQIVSNPNATPEQKELAAEKLLRLDPNNALVRDELRALLSP
jgi:O-antigen ligase